MFVQLVLPRLTDVRVQPSFPAFSDLASWNEYYLLAGMPRAVFWGVVPPPVGSGMSIEELCEKVYRFSCFLSASRQASPGALELRNACATLQLPPAALELMPNLRDMFAAEVARLEGGGDVWANAGVSDRRVVESLVFSVVPAFPCKACRDSSHTCLISAFRAECAHCLSTGRACAFVSVCAGVRFVSRC